MCLGLLEPHLEAGRAQSPLSASPAGICSLLHPILPLGLGWVPAGLWVMLGVWRAVPRAVPWGVPGLWVGVRAVGGGWERQ